MIPINMYDRGRSYQRPERMYVCLCKQLTDHHILEAYEAGHRDLDSLKDELGLGTNCGSCKNFTRDLISEIADAGVESFKP